jgi:hypothetical protein
VRIGLSWTWLAIAVVGPTLFGLLLAWPFWRRGQFDVGNTLGAGLVFAASIGLVGRELLYLFTLRESATRPLIVEPGDFTRSVIYFSIAFFDVMVIFLLGQNAEDRLRRRRRAREWR